MSNSLYRDQYPMNLKRHNYSNRDTLANALAKWVAEILKGSIADHGQASLALSGGSTPKAFLQALSAIALDWGKIDVVLVDERWVGEDDPRSNARMVRQIFLQNHAADAHFIPMYEAGERPEDAVAALNKLYGALARPFDVIVLGMGLDGHTASLFPDGGNIDTALDLNNPGLVMAMPLPGDAVSRMTMTLAEITRASNLALHITGEDKLAVLDGAVEAGKASNLPIAKVLQSAKVAHLFWSP